MLLFLDTETFDPIVFACFIIVAILAFAYHEFAHAIVADYLGDPTPRLNGRITLNPFPHLSLLGLVMLIIIGFGWAVTPINPHQLRGNPRSSHAIVAIAGPIANLIMAALFAIPLRLAIHQIVELSELVITLCTIGVNLNLFLIAFNLLPIPPLDGFWTLRGVLPVEVSHYMDGLLPYGMMIFFLVIFILPEMGLSIFPEIWAFTEALFILLVGI